MEAPNAADQGREANPAGLDDQQDLGFPMDLFLPPVDRRQVRDDVDTGSQPFLNEGVSDRFPDLSAGTGDQHHERPS